MATVVRMPEVLANVTEASIQTWLVAVGDSVSAGQALAEVETEKATVEFESELEGTVLQLLAQEGESMNVGAPIIVIGAAGESLDGLDLGAKSAGEMSAAAATEFEEGQDAPIQEELPEVTVSPTPADSDAPAAKDPEPARAASPAPDSAKPDVAVDPGSRRFASPIVRRLARERGIDLDSAQGTGPGGRIVRRDLDALAAAPPAPQRPAATAASPESGAEHWEEIPHTGMRRAIARRLTESKSTIPHFYIVADCRVDRLVTLRQQINDFGGARVSINDFVVKAAAAAFTDVPDANSTWTDTAVRRHHSVDIAIAVAVEGGLLTPVLRGIEHLSLGAIGARVAELAERARAGKLKQPELEGGSFAISNLGMYGVTEFSAIINPPQSGILAVGAARQQPVVDDGNLAIGTVMTVTLSADHRVLDGALAAQWMAAFVRRIENPAAMLA